MKIPSNRVSSVIKYFREQLADLYEKEEVENFIYFSFDELLGFTRTDLLTREQETMSESMLLKFNNVVKALKKQVPIQYVLGHTIFYGLKLKVDERVLIPRPETEELVDLIIKQCRTGEGSREQLSILDIGTGSGCIPIALKKNLPFAGVHALDVSAAALDLAKENAAAHHAEINFIHADILHPSVADQLGTYSIIVSNPPYVLDSEKEHMHPNVLGHEPHLALFVSDDDPLLFYRVIMELAKKKLRPGGKLYFEINERQGAALKELAESSGFADVTLERDISGKERILYAQVK